MSESEKREHDPWASVPRQDPAGPPAPPPGAYYGYQPPQPPQPPGAYAYYGYPPIRARKTNGLAIAAMVCGICGFLYLVPAVLGIIFGSIALRQTRRDATDGRGMAIAGIVTGAAWLAFVVVIILIVIAASGN